MSPRSGSLATNGSSVSVTNASYNGSVPPSASTTFGLLGSGTSDTTEDGGTTRQ